MPYEKKTKRKITRAHKKNFRSFQNSFLCANLQNILYMKRKKDRCGEVVS